ncbi:MAG: phosphatidylserine decarboxylase family protein [Bacteroidetes bacterium]|nr:phosphatidylserine decarboxylase family protein [Bacteroidota bacterium]
MKLHKEGYPVMVLVLFLLLAIVMIINLVAPTQTVIHYLLYTAGLIFYFFVVRFFRDPIRLIEPDPNILLSGADGKVVVIEEVFEKEYYNAVRKQVSIFMSPTDVHVNWFPISGRIIFFRHNQGSYFIASKPKSSSENERTSIVMETDSGQKIMFRQIAGTVARRIVCYAKEGKYADQGQELGIIKFGSRFDFFLPPDMKIDVKIGQKVIGNKTIIAHMD